MTDKMDYVEMFNLKPDELSLRILVCSKESSQSDLLKIEYVACNLLPNLPYPDQSFDLVLCPNTLFTDNNVAGEAFHLAALTELVRVGGEARVTPLVDQTRKPYQYLGSIIQSLQERGVGIELKQVQMMLGTDTKDMGANAMLRLWNPACFVKQDPKDISNKA